MSRNICARILGETDRVTIDDEMVKELKVKLPTTKQEEITAIYHAIH